MNQFEINQFLSEKSLSNHINSYSPSNLDLKQMDNFWCVDVPDNMPEAFNVVQNSLNQSSNSLFRFTGSTPNQSFTNLNSSSPANFDSNNSAQPSLSNNNNWKTIHNLHQASNLIGPYKRKSFLAEDEDDLINFQPPNKQNATEEKVIGKLTKLCIDEEFDDCSDEFFLQIEDAEIDEDLIDSSAIVEDDTDKNILNDESVQFELANEVQELWNCDDVITKLVKDEREKFSKALVLYQPRITFPTDQNDECKKDKVSEIVDQTDEYTVIEESDKKVDDARSNDDFELEITELSDVDSIVLNETDEDMMEI